MPAYAPEQVAQAQCLMMAGWRKEQGCDSPVAVGSRRNVHKMYRKILDWVAAAVILASCYYGGIRFGGEDVAYCRWGVGLSARCKASEHPLMRRASRKQTDSFRPISAGSYAPMAVITMVSSIYQSGHR